MIFKWALIMFAVATIGLVVLSKVLVFFNPPRPGRKRPPLLAGVERAIRWSLLLPAALAVLLLGLAMLGR